MARSFSHADILPDVALGDVRFPRRRADHLGTILVARASPAASALRLPDCMMLPGGVGYGLFAASVRRQVLSRPAPVRWMRRGFAGCYVALAGRLALAAR